MKSLDPITDIHDTVLIFDPRKRGQYMKILKSELDPDKHIRFDSREHFPFLKAIGDSQQGPMVNIFIGDSRAEINDDGNVIMPGNEHLLGGTLDKAILERLAALIWAKHCGYPAEED